MLHTLVPVRASCDAATFAAADVSRDRQVIAVDAHNPTSSGWEYMAKCEGTYPK